jgi:hypothetical protein
MCWWAFTYLHWRSVRLEQMLNCDSLYILDSSVFSGISVRCLYFLDRALWITKI